MRNLGNLLLRGHRRRSAPSALAVMLASCSLLLAACGSSGTGLIPEGNAIPLRSDFQAVAEAAREGGGECSATETAIRRMEHDFRTLPATVDRGLHSKLEEGVQNLRSRALVTCERQTSSTSSSTTSSSTTETSTTTTSTTTTSSTPTTTSTTTSTTSSEPITSDTYTYSETSTPPVTPSETGGTEASGESGASGGAVGEEPTSEEAAAQGGAAAGGIP